jgi:hypothetical protein
MGIWATKTRIFLKSGKPAARNLIFEYEMYAKALGTYDLLDYLKKVMILVNTSQEEIDACAAFFP